jgi:transmembrane sensor
MNKDDTFSDRHDKAELEAVAWFTRMQGNPSQIEREDFDAWLNADNMHQQIYSEISLLWSSAKSSGLPIHPADAALLEGRLQAIRRRRKLTKAGTVVIGCLGMLLTGSWIWLEKPHLLQDMRADYVSARGEQKTLELQDGSTVLLGADTAVEVKISDLERRVQILRGTAFFSVQPSDVPFIVGASNGEATVLGTAFDVSIAENNVTVTLEHGSLQVRTADKNEAVILKPGEEVFYSAEGVGQVQKVNLDEAMAWHEKRYVFTNARFADVIDYIARYHDGRIVVIGSQLADQRISGSFSLENTEAALASVQSITGFKINKLSERILIIRQ